MQVLKAAPSRLHVKVEPLIVEVNWKVAVVDVTVPLGPEVIVVSGGTTTVQLWLAGVASTLPAVSVACTWKVCAPPARAV